MRRAALAVAAALAAAPALAQAPGPMAGGGHMTPEAMRREMGGMRHGMVMIDRAEIAARDGRTHFVWDGSARYGGDIDRLWLESEGAAGLSDGGVETAAIGAAWSRAVTAYFDARAGLRYDFAPAGRTSLMLGVQGLAPYRFELDAAAYLDAHGDIRAALEAEYDLLLTQRLVLQPRAEAALALQDIPELRLGAGVTEVSLGVRLRYEIRRAFAPYAGVEWRRRAGETAQMARARGEDGGGVSAVAGLRVWF